MKKVNSTPYIVHSISELHRLLGLPKPEHPLVSLVAYEAIKTKSVEVSGSFVLGFYIIAIKKGFKGKMKYGQHHYDFDEGIMSFLAPGQVIGDNTPEDNPPAGWMLVLHPDFLRGYSLDQEIKNYNFFSYELNEALHLSEKEEQLIAAIVQNIEREYCSVTDLYSQSVILSHVALLLTYANRFYNRQFITRQQASNDLLVKLETLLRDYFNHNQGQERGLPTVQFLAEQLHLSPSYLSDMLRSLTGQNAQQHIHNQLIEKAKEILTTTSLSVSEIAYQLGFEYPQYFSKLFKSKTQLSPLAFRHSFN